MYESREEYVAIVRANVGRLERWCRCTVRHGDPGFCPRCGEEGVWDLEGLGFGAGFGNSIYYSTVFYEWRCRICDYRMIS